MENRHPNTAQVLANNFPSYLELGRQPTFISGMRTDQIPCVPQGSAVYFARLPDTQSRGETSLIDANVLREDK
jgi:hypothetical protein